MSTLKDSLFGRFEPRYDSYRPEYSRSLIDTLDSYLTSHPEPERWTREFITEVRESLYLINKYNCNVAKFTHKYPQRRKFDLLLIKYVKLECEALRHSQSCFKDELLCQIRILRFLQDMLRHMLSTDSRASSNGEVILNSAILRLLEDSGSIYSNENRVVRNIINKLVKSLESTNNNFSRTSLRNSFLWEIQGNLATSDYGTDDSDSDVGNEVKSPEPLKSSWHVSDKYESCKNWIGSKTDIETEDKALINTIDFTDDDDSYMVYLQKSIISKRKVDYARPKDNAKVLGPSESVQSNISTKVENTSIIICSDSEDESGEVPSSGPKTPPPTKAGVVTFEIIDDDDDDAPNYILSLQEEVPANKRKKLNGVSSKEVIVCCDSDDDSVENVVGTESQDQVQDQNCGVELVPIIFQEDSDLFVFKGELNFLIDPSSLMEEIQGDQHVLLDAPSSPGDPVLSPKADSLQDSETFQDCHLNDSLLEELLLDDSYLLEGRKEFELLESFLFGDSPDDHGSKTAEITTDLNSLFCEEKVEVKSKKDTKRKVRRSLPRKRKKYGRARRKRRTKNYPR